MPTALKLKKMAIITLSLFISSCVYYPKKIEHYDAQCDITFKKLELETKEMKDACSRPNSNDAAGMTCLTGVLTMSAVSAIVSGTIVIVGNIAYWLEKEGRCLVK